MTISYTSSILRARALVVLTAFGLLGACAKPAAPADGSAPSAQSAGPPSSAAAPVVKPQAPPGSAAAASSAAPTPAEAAPDGGAPDAAAAPASAPIEAPKPIVADNQVKPEEGTPEELTARAKGLFEAIVKDDPALGDPFWFPKEPFIPLKDVKGPDKYWDNLHKAFAADVHKAHKKRKSWEGATFVDFKVGSTPKWVKPGDEANKIGYYRSFHGKLRYEIDGKSHIFDVHTIITWQGRWYITHLSKFKK